MTARLVAAGVVPRQVGDPVNQWKNLWDFAGHLWDALGIGPDDAVAPFFEPLMFMIWEGSLAILRGGFDLADRFSVFTVSTTDGPVSVLWPMMLWIGGVLAFGLFLWQIITTVLHSGRGFTRLATGPFQYGIALAVTTGMVAAFLTSMDALTDGILRYGLHATNFKDALTVTGLGDIASDSVKAVVVGLAGVIGVIPAGLGFSLEMLFREASIYILVATVPLTAAGLLAGVTARWFWRTVRWLLAAIAMKPVLALTLVLGVAIAGGAQGVSGLLAGVGVLLVSLLVPLVLFKLFAFVDPNTDAGSAFRDALSSAGVDSYGENSVAGQAGKAAKDALDGGGDSGGFPGAGTAEEQANTERFDQAAGDALAADGAPDSGAGGGSGGDEGGDSAGAAAAEPEGDSSGDTDDTPPASDGGREDGDGNDPGGDDPPPAPPTDPGGDDTPPPSPAGGGGTDGPQDDGPAGDAADPGVEDAARVVV